jgi:hypothetical protein
MDGGGFPPRGPTWMVLEAPSVPKGVSSTSNSRRDDRVLTRRCLQGDGHFSARRLHRAPGKDRIVFVDGLVSMNPQPVFVRSSSLCE